ncbi:DUF1499 domain-containing protein [Marinomonas mediterranea]|uniref:DUF1499 domain-containing protein n=1 Tax=Marinomonas mediterranea TaxID=119864 RepID=UPI00234AA741|nr:DUF1499 domain-containing protein [Marinomonas mediterranea]WCN08947.1 DUF1499 domain-containing protein [Marinomonas mediterranea]
MSRYISPFLYFSMIFVGCMAFFSIAGVRVGMIEPITGFSFLRKSVFAALVLSCIAALSVLLFRRRSESGKLRFCGLILIVSLTYSTLWIAFYLQKLGLPKINDITTDTVVPPSYIYVPYIRKSSDNDLVYNHEWAELQNKFYPNVKPLEMKKSKDSVYAAAVDLMNEKGWQIVSKYPTAGIVEATARTTIFGFRDDVIVRIMEENDYVRIDMRSCSRMGVQDFGENAERITTFLNDLKNKFAFKKSIAFRY